jgi:hypothetical protein
MGREGEWEEGEWGNRREARGERARGLELGETSALDPPFLQMSDESVRHSSSTFFG